MNKIAWSIINGLCFACGCGFFIVLLLGGLKPKYDIIFGFIAITTVIVALIIGYTFFKF